MPQPDIHRYLRHGTLPQLRLFEAIARLGSFTRAAQELHMAQPTASVQIKKLSATVGSPLFEQVGKRLYLTDAGRRLYESCQEVFRAFTSLEASLAGMRTLESGRLRLAVSTTGMCFAPRLAGRLRRTPSRRRDVHAGPQPAEAGRPAREQRGRPLPLRRRAGAPRTRSRRSCCPILSSCSRADDHPLARGKEHPLRSPRQRTLPHPRGRLGRADGLRCGSSLRTGSLRRSGWSSARNEAIKEAILAGLGVTIMSRYTFGLDPESSRLPLPRRRGLSPSRTTGTSPIRRGSSCSPVARALLDFRARGGEERLVPGRRAVGASAQPSIAVAPPFGRPTFRRRTQSYLRHVVDYLAVVRASSPGA